MGGGGTSTNTTTQKADPWAGTQPYLMDVYGKAQTAANSTSTDPFGGNFITPVNSTQQQGVDATKNLAMSFQGIGDGAIKLGQDQTSGKYLDANNYLVPAIQGAVAPVIRNTLETTLPAIGSQAQDQGAYGGSRHAVVEGGAIRDMYSQVAQTAAQMFNQNYMQERQLQQNGQAITQAGMTMNTATPELLGVAGSQQYNLDNLATQQGLAEFQDRINAPWRAVMPYTNILSGVGMPGGQTTTTAPQGSALAGGLAGGLGGGALGYMASGGNPFWTLGGAALGGAAGTAR
jgi:hypothetical protein